MKFPSSARIDPELLFIPSQMELNIYFFVMLKASLFRKYSQLHFLLSWDRIKPLNESQYFTI